MEPRTEENPTPPQLTPKKVIEGGQGWALCMEILEKYIYIGTDDKRVKVFHIDTWHMSEEFVGHEDGITAVAFADDMLYTGSFDHSIRSWDLKEMHNRIRERAIMYREDLNVIEFKISPLPRVEEMKST